MDGGTIGGCNCYRLSKWPEKLADLLSYLNWVTAEINLNGLDRIIRIINCSKRGLNMTWDKSVGDCQN